MTETPTTPLDVGEAEALTSEANEGPSLFKPPRKNRRRTVAAAVDGPNPNSSQRDDGFGSSIVYDELGGEAKEDPSATSPTRSTGKPIDDETLRLAAASAVRVFTDAAHERLTTPPEYDAGVWVASDEEVAVSSAAMAGLASRRLPAQLVNNPDLDDLIGLALTAATYLVRNLRLRVRIRRAMRRQAADAAPAGAVPDLAPDVEDQAAGHEAAPDVQDQDPAGYAPAFVS